MTRRLIALCLAVGVLAAAATRAVHAAPSVPVLVAVDRTKVTTALGRTFRFTAGVANNGRRPTPPLVAQLDVLSLGPGTYVDPEDWASGRTRYLGSIPAGASRTIEWTVKAVNSGSFGVFVAVLPQSGAPAEPVTGPTVHVEIAERRTLNSGGILPLALGIPALLAALALGLRWQRQRR
jgi:hypothetical protein